MYRLIVLLTCLAVWVPGSQQYGPWGNNGGSGTSNTGFVDPRGPGWGSGGGSSSNGFGSNSGGASTSNDRSYRRCGSQNKRAGYASAVAPIESRMLSMARRMTTFCSTYSDRQLREIYGVEHFKLRVQLNEFSEDDVEVLVQQRLVTVAATSCSAEFAAVRFLPDVVSAREAVWKMENHTLTVYFPYNIAPNTELQSRCGREFSADRIIVPKCEASRQFQQDYDMSFTNAHLKEAIRRALQELADEGNEQYVDK